MIVFFKILKSNKKDGLEKTALLQKTNPRHSDTEQSQKAEW